MKVRRICKNCNSTWHDTEGVGDVLRPGNLLRIAFNALLVGYTKGSIIDMQYSEAQHQTRKRTCPNCGSMDTYFKKVGQRRNIEARKRKKLSNREAQEQIVKTEVVKTEVVVCDTEKQQASGGEQAISNEVNWTSLFFISLLSGFFGIDRFYVGKKASGVLKLLTLGGLGIWWAVDLLIIACGQFTDASGNKIRNTSKQRVLALIFITPLAMFYLTAALSGIFFGIFSSPEEREQRKVEQEQRKAEQEQRKAEQEQKKAELEQIKQQEDLERRQAEAVQESEKPKSKKQEYEETYGEKKYAKIFYKMFRDQPLAINKICNEGRPRVQIVGEILDMGSNSYGNYIDLYTHKEYPSRVKGDIRVFLIDSEWNNKAIEKIKRRNMIGIGGLCYGQTEVSGIKSKIIIGNATILYINGKFL